MAKAIQFIRLDPNRYQVRRNGRILTTLIKKTETNYPGILFSGTRAHWRAHVGRWYMIENTLAEAKATIRRIIKNMA